MAAAQRRAPVVYDAVANGDTTRLARHISAGKPLHVMHKGTHPLHLAARLGYTAVVQMLLDAGYHVDARTCSGNTALIEAATHNRRDVIAVLLEYGADPFVREWYRGMDAGFWAKIKGHYHAHKALLRAQQACIERRRSAASDGGGAAGVDELRTTEQLMAERPLVADAVKETAAMEKAHAFHTWNW